MMRLSIYMTALRKLSLALLLGLALPFAAKSQLGITIVTSPSNPQPGDIVTADVLAYNFQDIVSMQFTMQWEETKLSFTSISSIDLPSMSAANFGINQVNNGILSFSWIDQALAGVTVPDCSRIFSIAFQVQETPISPIVITSSPVEIEIVSITNGSSAFWTLEQNLGCSIGGAITGNVFNDLNADCQFTAGETGLEGWKIAIENNGITQYRSTDFNGDYFFYLLPGTYQITPVLPQNNLWTTCLAQQTVTINDQPVAVDFPAHAIFNCPQLTVDIAAPFLRRCFNSTYHVHYCNQGTVNAEAAYVEVTLDPYVSAVSSSIPWTTVDGQTYTFPIGDVAVGECGDFSLDVFVSCDAVLGQAHCTEAHIFPDEICQPVNALWDGSILDVTGTCDGDSVRFIITNIGDDMDMPVPFIVIEDDMVNFSGSPIQLNAGGSHEVAVPANGATWRVELDNEQISPFNAATAYSLEGCGVNGSGTFSLGFVTQFPQGDASPFTDVDCQPNVGSYDPNDKTGYPNGYCTAHYIESNQNIEYKIRFQNTGTDTAFTVVVRDTLPLSLDPATVQPGASSHAYDFELLGNGVVQFTFPNIMLPDSSANEMASHGFVNFSASQLAGNGNGTVINNQAAIYFDLNDPVFTNTYTHTVADDFVQSAGTDGNLSVSGHVRTWYGTPLEDVAVTLTPTCPINTDNDGYFEFLELDTAGYALFASKPNLDKQAGVTVLDAIMLRQIILQFSCLNPEYLPYQLIAGELNASGSVTTYDLVQLSKMAIGLDIGNMGQHWKFVDANYEFPVQSNPLSSFNAPTTIEFDLLSESVDSADFFGIKPGNLVDESLVDSSTIQPAFYFETSPLPNGKVKAEVKVNGFVNVKGFQFGLSWDPNALTLLNGDSLLWANDLVAGKLQWLQFYDTDQSFPDGSTIFTLLFDALASTGTSTDLSLDQSLLPFQVVVEDCKLADATMENATIDLLLDVPTSELGVSMSIAPNPMEAGQSVFVNINSKTSQSLELHLYDANGRLIQAWEKEVPSGNSSFPLAMPLAKGLYFLKTMDENGGVAAMKLVSY